MRWFHSAGVSATVVPMMRSWVFDPWSYGMESFWRGLPVGRLPRASELFSCSLSRVCPTRFYDPLSCRPSGRGASCRGTDLVPSDA